MKSNLFVVEGLRQWDDVKPRLCQFRKSDCELFSCYCTERQAYAALNFVRFLD